MFVARGFFLPSPLPPNTLPGAINSGEVFFHFQVPSIDDLDWWFGGPHFILKPNQKIRFCNPNPQLLGMCVKLGRRL